MCLAKARFVRYKLSLLRFEAKQSESKNYLGLKESDFSNPHLRGQLIQLSNRLLVKKHRSKSVVSMHRSSALSVMAHNPRKDWSVIRNSSIRTTHIARLTSLKEMAHPHLQRLQNRPLAPLVQQGGSTAATSTGRKSSGLGSYGSKLKSQLKSLIAARGGGKHL